MRKYYVIYIITDEGEDGYFSRISDNTIYIRSLDQAWSTYSHEVANVKADYLCRIANWIHTARVEKTDPWEQGRW